ncbi:MAG: IclR family transcriptional regulator [Deltaproteobacteria bacterium]|nr:IclR family transcriptional regulator [Deltaproteobacteria bacterium]
MSERRDSEGPAYLVPALSKAFRVLELLKGEDRELTAAQIAKATGWHKSTVQKLLVTLGHYGAVDRDEGTRRYSLGIALADYGRIALRNLDVRRAARPLLKALVDAAGETAVLAVLHGSKVIFVDKAEPPIQIRVSPQIGWRIPATANALGKALIAWLPEPQIAEMIRKEGLSSRTPKTIVDPLAYRKDLAATRERGYSDEYEEFHEGINAVAAPVFNSRGEVIATLSVCGPTFRMTAERMQEFGRRCVEMASTLSHRLSGA